MKKSASALLIGVVALAACSGGMFESPAAKAYRVHRERIAKAEGFSRDVVAQRKWSLAIDECAVSGSTATVRATQKTATIPPNAASFVFATIVTRRFEAKLERRGGQWAVVEDKLVGEETSTWEDRRP